MLLCPKVGMMWRMTLVFWYSVVAVLCLIVWKVTSSMLSFYSSNAMLFLCCLKVL